ncbi:MAG TPA: HD domain-containing protein [Bacilli bacterium]|nr:HD domain-containing protein [Bacilli bacterium]HQA19852.1 HD domain-containing protein [Bacilli bacterium]HQD92614.1 HD domain-containing protein [Bacilli bacterium]
MKKLSEKKVFRDPLYGYIEVEHQTIWDLINAKEFQRLKRIKQLGGVNSVFHTAEHSRFSHSLGVYNLAKVVTEKIEDIKNYLSERDKLLLYCASLLHDIGHGPFSHAFESSFGVNHEDISIQIILGNTEVNQILNQVDEKFAQDVADVISKKTNNKVILELVSSQLDLDRLDYLERDAYFTGAKYGEIDVDRIMRTMQVKNDMLVHKYTSVIAIEDYLMSRYNMYWQVYFHPVGRSFELIIEKVYKRIKELYNAGTKFNDVYTPLIKLLNSNENINLYDYLRIDDHVIYNIILESEYFDDPILSDLSSRLIHRRLFKDMVVNSDNQGKVEEIKQLLISKNINLDYYFIEDSLNQLIYAAKYDLDLAANIKLVMANGEIKELKNVSKIINALVDIADKRETRVYYPLDFIK